MSKVSRQQIWDQLGKRPFQPFRLTLIGGETLDVVRIAQAVVTPREMIIGVGDDRTRWVPLKDIDRMDVFEIRQSA